MHDEVKPLHAHSSRQKIGILVCGHGSRNRFAVDEFAKVTEGLRAFIQASRLNMVISNLQHR